MWTLLGSFAFMAMKREGEMGTEAALTMAVKGWESEGLRGRAIQIFVNEGQGNTNICKYSREQKTGWFAAVEDLGGMTVLIYVSE